MIHHYGYHYEHISLIYIRMGSSLVFLEGTIKDNEGTDSHVG